MDYLRRFWQWITGMGRSARGGSEFLCDSCRYNYRDACNRPERPNATTCPDYKHK